MDKQIESAPTPSFLPKVFQFPLTRIFLALLFVVGSVILTTVLLSLIRNQFFPAELIWSSVKFAIPIILVAYFSYRWYVRLVEKRSVDELSKKGALKELGAGVLLGTIVVAVVPIGMLWLLGYYRVTGVNDWRVMLAWFADGSIFGVAEEIVFRGIIFRITEEWLGTWWAIIISALLFWSAHLLNENNMAMNAIFIAPLPGILLASAYLLTRRLWLPIGIHFAWDFVQAGVFGTDIPGETFKTGLLQAEFSGAAWVSGGAAAPDASIFTIVLLLSVATYLLIRAKQKGHLVRPFRARD